jgi:hypothetical protein
LPLSKRLHCQLVSLGNEGGFFINLLRVNLILAHQYLGQLETEVRDSVFGNAGTFISFRVGALDASTVARELSPKFEPDDLLSLPNFSVYLRLMIDGEPSKPFSAGALRL